MKLKALIADDEYPAREELRLQLQQFDQIEVVGEAATVVEAITLINAMAYDLVFLDINFPVSNGIDLGKMIHDLKNPPQIVYVTAFDKYAVDAFGVDATDYLLKPIDTSKMKRAIQKVIRNYIKDQNINDESLLSNSVSSTKETVTNNPVVKKISAELNGKIYLIDENEIIFAFVDQNYVFIKRYNDTLITRYTLLSLEEKLTSTIFFRANRGQLINLNKVKEISSLFKGSVQVIMDDEEKSSIDVSRRQSTQLRKIFDI